MQTTILLTIKVKINYSHNKKGVFKYNKNNTIGSQKGEVMGKSIRLDAKYPNQMTKESKIQNPEHNEYYEGKKSKKSQKSKKFFKKDFHIQRIWPKNDESKKGPKV